MCVRRIVVIVCELRKTALIQRRRSSALDTLASENERQQLLAEAMSIKE